MRQRLNMDVKMANNVTVKSKVALVRCSSYDDTEVSAAIAKGINLLGGISQFIKPGERILIKPNMLIGSSPEKSVTTHPAVFKAVGKLLQQAGARIYYGDSPTIGSCESNFKKAGLKQIGDELGFTLADFDHGREVPHPQARLNMKFTIANGVLDSDGLISLPKFKTHGLTRFTGAVKNQFGCVPGILKGQFHAKIADPYEFAAMLVDLNTLIRPRLYIMDGISAMEGNGPRNGNPRQMNLLLLSADPVALDATACRMIDLNPEFVPTSQAGEQAGLGTYRLENIELAGDSLDSFKVADFDVVKAPPEPVIPGRLFTFVRNHLTPRPVIASEKCTACGTCIKMCPIGTTALDWNQNQTAISSKKAHRRIPKHNYDKCIRCYCCQETCPEGAITIQNPPLAKLLFRT